MGGIAEQERTMHATSKTKPMHRIPKTKLASRNVMDRTIESQTENQDDQLSRLLSKKIQSESRSKHDTEAANRHKEYNARLSTANAREETQHPKHAQPSTQPFNTATKETLLAGPSSKLRGQLCLRHHSTSNPARTSMCSVEPSSSGDHARSVSTPNDSQLSMNVTETAPTQSATVSAVEGSMSHFPNELHSTRAVAAQGFK
jgi:hypothetical protein